MKRSVKLQVLLFLSSALLAGCNTTRGVGEDIQGLGHAISHAVS
ncbi:TPA: entericidin A/B family lipoprotein [Klebsiella pneumoniae]|nr:entericidin A/B family lipoprotein [Klebsiella pneumoniae]